MKRGLNWSLVAFATVLGLLIAGTTVAVVYALAFLPVMPPSPPAHVTRYAVSTIRGFNSNNMWVSCDTSGNTYVSDHSSTIVQLRGQTVTKNYTRLYVSYVYVSKIVWHEDSLYFLSISQSQHQLGTDLSSVIRLNHVTEFFSTNFDRINLTTTGITDKVKPLSFLAIDSIGQLYTASQQLVSSSWLIQKQYLNGTSELFDTMSSTEPTGLAVDLAGNVYFASAQQIKKISPGGQMTVLAGNGTAGHLDGPGMQAMLSKPIGMVLDSRGSLFFTDDVFVRSISPSGFVSTIAGNGTKATIDGIGMLASFHSPYDIAADSQTGRLFVTDSVAGVVRMLTPV